jgi:hypothetical protein
MAVNASKVKSILDVADAVTLRDITDGAETATATETAVSLNELRDAYWHGREIPAGKIVVGVHISALNLSTNTYVLALMVDDVLAMNNSPVAVASMPVVAAGYYEFVVDAATIAAIDTDDTDDAGRFMAIRCTVAGVADSPSITYGAWIAKSLRT